MLGRLKITPDRIDAYLLLLEQEGKTKNTLAVNRAILRSWYKSLPEEKIVTEDVLDGWKRAAKELIAERTWENRERAVKSFLVYLEDPDSFKERKKKTDEPTPELVMSREEYHLLLQTAKEMGHRRTYLLIKTIVCLGVRTTEMPHLNVEGLEEGTAWIPFHNKLRQIQVFEPIRSELLEFAAECGMKEGPVFLTQEGQPMQHFLIWKEIKKVCRRMGLPEQKGTPKSLYQLYIHTRKEIAKESAEEAGQKYLALLQKEETTIGWTYSITAES